MKLTQLVVLAIGLLLGLSVQGATSTIRLATTTSTENSGLLGVLLPPFEKESGYEVHVIAVGTGKALRLAREGDVDLVLVHARADEDRLVADGYGVSRRDVMYNDFVIIGPPNDPAGIRGLRDAVAALTRIAATTNPFVSRGDESGTHKKEQSLWQAAGITPTGRWYREAGQGMGKVLLMAGELDAYTLTDRGTWLAYRDRNPLEILAQGDERLFNPYGIIATNPAKYPEVNHPGAMRLIEWITSRAGQAIIHAFRRHGELLFIPLAIPLATPAAQ